MTHSVSVYIDNLLNVELFFDIMALQREMSIKNYQLLDVRSFRRANKYPFASRIFGIYFLFVYAYTLSNIQCHRSA